MLDNFRHDIPMWRAYEGNGWAVCSVAGGTIISVVAIVMILIGYIDPAASVNAVYAGFIILGIVGLNGLMFALHLETGRSANDAKVIRAYRSIPKDERKRFDVDEKSLLSLDYHEQNALSIEIYKFVSNTTTEEQNRARDMLSTITEVNKVYKEMEYKR